MKNERKGRMGGVCLKGEKKKEEEGGGEIAVYKDSIHWRRGRHRGASLW